MILKFFYYFLYIKYFCNVIVMFEVRVGIFSKF